MVRSKKKGIFAAEKWNGGGMYFVCMSFSNKIFIALLLLLAYGCHKEGLGVPDKSHYRGQDFVSETEAAGVANAFLNSLSESLRSTISEDAEPQLQGTDIDLLGIGDNSWPAYYIFTLKPSGFVIVSASNRTPQILGYSTENDLSLEGSIPDHVKSFLLGYSADIAEMRSSLPNSPSPHSNLRTPSEYRQTIVPALLGHIMWNQGRPYNALCPDQCPVGCVATATAQVMRYWEYPSIGQGSHGYKHKIYGKLSTNFQYPIKWDKLSRSPDESKSYPELARFNYDIAVGLDMEFERSGSGASSLAIVSLLKKHYNYAGTVRQVYKGSYTEEEWHQLMRNELKAKRPIIYSGFHGNLGHTFVCDGYDSADYYHINWGWGGRGNGWFKLDGLSPSTAGIGAGSGHYNQSQDAIIGIEPPRFESKEEVNLHPLPDYKDVKVQKVGLLYIRSFVLNSVRNTSGATGYAQYTNCAFVATIGEEVSYEVELGQGFGSEEGYLTAWVDLNLDGTFAPEERLFSGHSRGGKISGKGSLPSDVDEGEYRLRLILSVEEVQDAHREIVYGEVEDYVLSIVKQS